MKRSFKYLILPFILLTSCNKKEEVYLVSEERDITKLLLGGYKTAQERDIETNEIKKVYDHYFYIRFCDKEYTFNQEVNDYSYDLEIDLNAGNYENYSKIPNCGYFDVGEYLKGQPQLKSFKTINEYFIAKNYITVFTSIGKINKNAYFCSKRIKLDDAGYIYSFSTINKNNEKLKLEVEEVLKETVYVYDVKMN